MGEYGWAGAAKTYYWIDPKKEIIGIFLTQSMCNFSILEKTFQTLVYQAIVKYGFPSAVLILNKSV